MVLRSELRDEDVLIMSAVAERSQKTVDPAIQFTVSVSNVADYDLHISRAIVRLGAKGVVLGTVQWQGETVVLRKKTPSNAAELTYVLSAAQRAHLDRLRRADGGLVLELYVLAYVAEMDRPIPGSLRVEVQGRQWDQWSEAWGAGGDLEQRVAELERQVELIKGFVADTDKTFGELLAAYKRSELTQEALQSLVRSTKAIEGWVQRQAR